MLFGNHPEWPNHRLHSPPVRREGWASGASDDGGRARGKGGSEPAASGGEEGRLCRRAGPGGGTGETREERGGARTDRAADIETAAVAEHAGLGRHLPRPRARPRPSYASRTPSSRRWRWRRSGGWRTGGWRRGRGIYYGSAG